MNMRTICALAILIGGTWLTEANGQGGALGEGASADTQAQSPDPAGKIKAEVILIRADWTGDDGVEGAEEILDSLLGSVPVPRSYTSLAANAPRLLFPEQFLSIYDPGELGESIVWMAQRNLIGGPWDIKSKERTDKDGPGEWRSQSAGAFSCSVFVDVKAVPLPRIVVGEGPPYVHRVIGTEFLFDSNLNPEPAGEATTISVVVRRTIQIRDEIKNSDGDTIRENITTQSADRFSFEMPLDKLAVFPFYHASAQRPKGRDKWYPIVVITPAALDIPDTPGETLTKPSALVNIRAVGNLGLRGSRTTLGGMRASSAPARAEGSPDTVIKVFALQHTKAASAVAVLTQLLDEGKFVADERTNSVIATGASAELEMVEKLLLQLDRPAESSTDGLAGVPRDRPSLEEFRRSLRGQFSTREEQALSVAQALAAEQDAEAARRLRERLKIVVTEAFGLRQELQKAELELLRERIRGIETQLQQRESLRDEIIERRVEQLAGGQPPTRSTPPANSGDQPAEAARNASPENE